MNKWLQNASDSVTWWLGSSARVFQAFAAGFLTVAELSEPQDDPNEFSPEEIIAIRRNLEAISRDIEILNKQGMFEELGVLIKSLFGNYEETRESLNSWINLIDNLAQEIEQYHGNNPGMGRFKKLHLRGALLYFIQQSKFQLSSVPAYLQPFFFDFGLDPLIDGVVRLLNRNDLWDDAIKSKSTLSCYSTVAVRFPSSFLYIFSRFMTGLSWKIVFWFNPVGGPIKKSIDGFLLANPDSLRKPILLIQWIVAHSGDLEPLVDLAAAAAVEAQRLLTADDARKKAYAREVVLVFIDDTMGLPEPGSLAREMLDNTIDGAIEMVVFLFKKRQHPAFRSAPTPPAVVDAA